VDWSEPSPFLRVPPFPGAKVTSLARPRSAPVEAICDEEIDSLIEEARRLQVGGAYWEPPAVGAQLPRPVAPDVREWFRREVVEPFEYTDPFTGQSMSVVEAIRLCGFWRQLIQGNRQIGTAVGFAFWKRPTIAPMLWDGAQGPAFASTIEDVDASRAVAVWKARTPPALLRELERSGSRLIDVEDGFIRSAGLGADCVPPLSIVVDSLGAHFDPSGPTELEQLIEHGPFPPELIDRSARLRQLIVESGVGKYGPGSSDGTTRSNDRLHVLVGGQVEDDRAVLSVLSPVKTNAELLRRVREDRPDAHIIYKPHPDVEAGHRAGRLSESEILQFADEIAREGSITSLIDIVDEIHVISSLAGFEALLRGKRVTTYGEPFYAGWSLTTDLGVVPGRRTAKRTLDELVAAVLILYPRYLDPVTGLPCPPEVLVRRLATRAGSQHDGLVVHLRRLQGRLKKRITLVGLGR
jgi:capsular polysaccharide export protein